MGTCTFPVFFGLTLFFTSETNECDLMPCQNGATCKDFVNDFNCTCVDGYEGTLCETGNVKTGCDCFNSFFSKLLLSCRR